MWRFILALLRALRHLLYLAYLLVFRTALYVVALWLVVYFYVNSEHFRPVFEPAMQAVLGGRMEAAAWRWGPIPWQGGAIDIRFLTPGGQTVIDAAWADGEIDLGDLLRWCFDAVVLGSDEPFRLHVTRGVAHGFVVRLDFDEENNLALVDAFVAPDDEDEDEDDRDDRPMVIHVSNAVAEDGRVLLNFPAWGMDLDVEAAEADIHYEDDTFVTSRLVSVRRGTAWIDLPPAPGLPDRLEPRLGRTHVEGFRWLGDALAFDRVQAHLDGTVDLDAAGAMSFADEIPTFRGSAHLEATGLPPVARALVGDRTEGAFTLVASGAGTFDDVQAAAVLRAPAVTVAGTELADVGFSVGLRRGAPRGDERPYELRLPAATFHADGGQVRVADAVWRPSGLAEPLQGGGPAVPVQDEVAATLWLDDADLGAWLARLGVTDAAPAPARGRLTGRVGLRAGRFQVPEGDLWQVTSALALDAAWDPAGDGRPAGEAGPPWPVAPRYAVDGALAYLARSRLEHAAPLLSGERLVVARDVRVRSGRDELRLDGELSLASGALNVTAEGALARMGGLLAVLGLPEVDGRLRLTEARVTGSLAAPRAEGRVAVSDVVWGRERLGEASFGATLEAGALRLRRVQARGPWGRLEGDGWLQVAPAPEAPADEATPPGATARAGRDGPSGRRAPARARARAQAPEPGRFVVERLSAHELALDQLLPGRRLAGAADLTIDHLTGDVRAPLRSLVGRGRFVGRDVHVEGERLRRVQARLEADARTLSLHDVRATLMGGGGFQGDLTWDKQRRSLLAELHVPPLPLGRLAALESRDPPVAADVGLDLRIEGDPDDPHVEGRLRVSDARVRLTRGRAAAGRAGAREGQWLRLGDAEVSVVRRPGGPAILSSRTFFPGFRLREGSQIALRGLTPLTAVVRVQAQDWDPSKVLPWMAAAQAEAAITAEGELRADLREGRWEVAVGAPAGGLRFRLQKGRVEFVNPDPLAARVGRDGLVVAGLVLAGSDGSRVAACGSYDARGLDLALSGDVTAEPLRLLLRRSISRMDGRVLLTGDAAARPAACAADLLWEAGGALLVRGPLARPELEGRVEVTGLALQPRGFGRELTLSEPAVLHVSPAGSGRTRLAIRPEAPVRAAVEDGSFVVWGEAELQDFVPSSGRVEFRGSDLTYSAPKSLTLTFDPHLVFTFADMEVPDRRTSRIAGDVEITEGAYYRSFDTLARAFGGALSREQATPTQSLTQALPALADTALDVRVTGQNVAVTSGFTFGTTDLELRIDVRVRGTLAHPQLWDRIEVVPGGLVTYKIVRREFEVVRGYLDFRGDPETPRLDLEARTEIEYYEDRTASSATLDTAPLDDERVVTITVALEGTYPEIDVDLSSDERGWDQADLQSFVLTGAPASSTRGARAARSINLFTDDIANLANKLLLSAFVDAMTLGVTPQGGIDWGVIASLGRNLKLRTRVLSEGTDRQYRARFEFRISERLSLEGQLKVNEEGNESTRTYESKLRYRIPLD
jgi:hypothetical protein